MRTTLEIDDDILVYVKATARARGTSTGKVISDIVRSSLTAPASYDLVNGIPVFPKKPDGMVVTLEFVNELRDEE
jgi:hypothetical protein